MSRTILVTGASGTLGRHLVRELESSGYEVRGQYCTKPGAAEGVDWRHMNFIESLDFSSLVSGCDAIIHLAAETNNPSLMYRVNVEATAALITAARSAGVRYFGYTSSIVVYGSPRTRVIDEVTPVLDPRASLLRQYRADPAMLEYARTKVLAERTTTEFPPSMRVDIYRPTVVADLDRMLEVRYWSTLRKIALSYRWTQYIYVYDVVAAILHLMEQGFRSPNLARNTEIFNLADENCGTYGDILRLIYSITRDPRYKANVELPIPMAWDLCKEWVKYRQTTPRYSLGMVRVRNGKLLATGYRFPFGMQSAVRQALARPASHPTRVKGQATQP